MKTDRAILVASLLCWFAGGPDSLFGQVILNPNQIRGTIRFTNTNPAILSVFGPPGNHGFTNSVAYASSRPPAPALSHNTLFTPTGRTSTPYEITVESSPAGIEYNVSLDMRLDDGHVQYLFEPAVSAPVLPEPSPDVTVDLDECAGLLDIRFVDAGGAPVPVTIASIAARPSPFTSYYGQSGVFPYTTPVTNQFLPVRGGDSYQVEILYETGTNIYSDRIRHRQLMTTNVACDQVIVLNCVVPAPSTLGQIIGNVDMLGEFELRTGGFEGYPERTVLVAEAGPFDNVRWHTLPGTNFTVPSSGAFALTNLLPSDATSPAKGYRVYSSMHFRTNNRFEYFLSPALGDSSNAPVSVAAGSTVNLSNTFVMNPGYLTGRIFLKGPTETPSSQSQFRGLLRPADYDMDDDGIPDRVSIYGNYYSAVIARGVDRRAMGAAHTAAWGSASATFEGSFNGVTSAFEGDYELVLAGLGGERSYWRPDELALTLYGDTPSTPASYYYNVFRIEDRQISDFEVVPTQRLTNDLSYCFSEVAVRFRSTSGTFFNPAIRFSSGTFTGTDFLGRPADYAAYMDAAFGTPVSQSTATNQGLVTMYLPQGSYALRPFVDSVNPGGGFSTTELPTLNLTVGCMQRIRIEQCLQVNLDLPTCSTSRTVTVTGSVRSCSNVVGRISYRLNGGPELPVCVGCGPDPVFSFPITLTGTCTDNTLTVTASDGVGVSAVTSLIRFDNLPPGITCPSNIAVECTSPAGTPVTFSPVASDNCGGPIGVVCTPPSGSLFRVGNTVVTCYALDGCGNRSRDCTFVVTVRDRTPPVINCPTGIVVSCSSTQGARVAFTVTATDNCDTNVSMICTPPSGSLFPQGTNIVICTARDDSGNTNVCRFTVAVLPSEPSIERAVIVRWSCGVLQGADEAAGPWADVPGAISPYCVPSSGVRRFYRVRQ